MNKNIKKMNLVYCLAQGFYWCAACSISTYAAFFLRKLGYSNTELGLIISLANLLAFTLPLFISPLIDRSERLDSSKAVLLAEGVEILLGVYVFLFGRKGLTLSVVYVIWLGLSAMIGPLCTQIALDYTQGGQPVSFGVARAFGSFAFVFASAGLGQAVERVSCRLLSAFAVIMGLLEVGSILWLTALSRKSPLHPVKGQAESSLSLKEFISQHRSFTLLLVGIAFTFMGYYYPGTYMINIVEELGGSAGDMGTILAFCAFMEIPSMLFFARVGQKSHSNRLLIASLICFSAKILFYYISWSVPMLYFSGVFQMLAYGLYTPAIVEYIRRNIPYKDSVKGQALAGAMCTLGSMATSFLGGLSTDAIGVKASLLLFFGVSALGSAVSVAAIRQSERAVVKKSPVG